MNISENWQTIAGILGVLVIAMLCFFLLKNRKPLPSASELDATLVETYIQYVVQGNFTAAYQECLDTKYRRDISLGDFQKAHEKRRTETGLIQRLEIRKVNRSFNLFSRVNTYQIMYALQCAGKERFGWIVISDADGEWRIEGTYDSSLRFTVW